MYKEFKIKSTKQVEFINITSEVNKHLKEGGIREGVLVIYIPHTTAAVTINENSDPNVSQDIIKEVNNIIPFSDNYKHFEGNSAAHIKSSLLGCSETVIVKNSRLNLGRWQGIFFCEFDGPRTRSVRLRLMSV